MDDLDDFIIDDEEADSDDNKQELREAKLARREVKRELVKNMGITYGISDETWREIDDLFGDGSDYQWALDLDKMSIEDSKDMNGALMRGAQVEKAEVKLTDLYEPSEIHAKMLTEEDEVIRIKDIPERYQVRVSLFDTNSYLETCPFIMKPRPSLRPHSYPISSRTKSTRQSHLLN